MDVDDIAREMECEESISRLSLQEAISLLAEKTSRYTEYSVLIPALALEDSVVAFSNGVSSLGEVKERAETLAEAANDVLSLVSAILDKPKPELSGFYGHAVVLMRDNRYKESAYQLSEAVGKWKGKDISDDTLLENAKAFAFNAHAAYRNTSLFETNVGSHFKICYIHKDESPAPVVYDKALFESVATGAIAIRPAVLGGTTQQTSEVSPRKKNRWYLRYVVAR